MLQPNLRSVLGDIAFTPEGGLSASDSVIMTVLQGLNQLAPAAVERIFESQSEVWVT